MKQSKKKPTDPEIIGTIASTPQVNSIDPRGQNPVLTFILDCGPSNQVHVTATSPRLVALKKQLGTCRPVACYGIISVERKLNATHIQPL
jgi:hypothetical protein